MDRYRIYLSKTAGDAERNTYLDEAMSQLDRVSTIAQQTLRFARKQDGLTRCAPAAILDAVMTLLRPKLELMQTEIVREVLSERELSCTPGEIQQVMTNIINNAVDAMGRNGRLRIRVSDSTCWRDTRTRGVRVTISDNGLGMAPEVLRRMREPFFTTKTETGTGLGMWVAYELVARNQGSLTVRTKTTGAQHGTVFSLFLPGETEALS